MCEIKTTVLLTIRMETGDELFCVYDNTLFETFFNYGKISAEKLAIISETLRHWFGHILSIVISLAK
jgi:hypothetical protein